MTAVNSLPDRFPVGTRFVVEGKPGKNGRLQVLSRYLVMPDGARIELSAAKPKPRPARKRRKRVSVRRAA